MTYIAVTDPPVPLAHARIEHPAIIEQPALDTELLDPLLLNGV